MAQRVAHVLRSGGRKFREAIGARRGDWNAGFADQRLCDWVRGHSNTHRIQSRGQPIGHMRLLRQHQGQRPGPEFPGQFFGALRPLAHQATRHFDRTHVNDQRAGRRPALSGIDFVDRRNVERVGSQPVYSLRWKCDQFTRADQFSSAVQLGRVTAAAAIQANPLFRRPRFCRCVYRPGTHASNDPGRHPSRDLRRRWKAWCDDPSPCDTARARSCGSGCRN